MMTVLPETMERLLLLIRSGYPVLYIVSHEEERVLDYLTRLVRILLAVDPHKTILRWYEGEGLQQLGGLEPFPVEEEQRDWLAIPGMTRDTTWRAISRDNSPAQALGSIRKQDMKSVPAVGDSLTVFFDLHQYLRNDSHTRGPHGSLVRTVRNTAAALRQNYDRQRDGAPGRCDFPYKTVVIVAPSTTDLSVELERDMMVIDFPLPEQDELLLTLQQMIERNILRFPSPLAAEEIRKVLDTESSQQVGAEGAPARIGAEDLTRAYQGRLCDLIAGAGRGLTLEAFKLGLNGFAVRGEVLSVRHIEDMLYQKAKAITNPALEYTPHVEIDLGGLENIKTWIRLRRDPARYESVREKHRLPPLKGLMLCGVSGGGKSMLAKLVAKEFNLALLRLDVGALFGMYVGESEERTRRALQLSEVLAPVVLWLDEVEKAFSGIGGSGDSGVSARVFGAFLTWLAEKQNSVFVVATANDFRSILQRYPEFGRKGRFDEIFWVDLPDQESRKRIFQIYLGPHFRDRFLVLTDDEVESLAQQFAVPPVQGADVSERFADLLSDPSLSGNMTGAEIEYSIKECLYEIYNLPEHDRSGGTIGRLIIETVQKAMERALYKANGPEWDNLLQLRSQAEMNGWPFVGGQVGVDQGV
jgi:hypothetical protein